MRMLAEIIHTLVGLYILGLIIYVILSWTTNPKSNVVRTWLGQFYVPILDMIARKVKPVALKPGVAVDLSPVILIFALYILRSLVITLLVPRF